MNNERLRVLIDALVRLTELWTKVSPGAPAHSVYAQIDFIRKKINEELKKS